MYIAWDKNTTLFQQRFIGSNYTLLIIITPTYKYYYNHIKNLTY